MVSASLEQSAGRPSTAIPSWPLICVVRVISGEWYVIPCEVADCTFMGATVKTSPRGSGWSSEPVSWACIALIPGAKMPSSFVSRMCIPRA